MEFFVEKGNFMTSIQKSQALAGWEEFWEYVEKKCG